MLNTSITAKAHNPVITDPSKTILLLAKLNSVFYHVGEFNGIHVMVQEQLRRTQDWPLYAIYINKTKKAIFQPKLILAEIFLPLAPLHQSSQW